jgi:hypothetical protein
MAERPPDTSAGTIAEDIVVLGFHIVGDEISNLPDRVAAAFKKPDVQAVIQRALDEAASHQMEMMTGTLSPRQQQEIAKKLATTVGGAVGSDVLKQVENSSKVKDLTEQAQALVKALEKTPVGVWFDKNEKLILIVAAGAALAGVGAMYVTRSGDTVAKLATSAIGTKSVKFKKLGNLELGGLVPRFVPSQRTVEMKIFAKAEWKGIKAEFTLVGQAIGTKVTVTPSGQIVIPVARDVIVKASATGNPNSVDCSVGLGIKKGAQQLTIDVLAHITPQGTSGAAGLGYKDKYKGIPFEVQGTGGVDPQGKVKVMATFTVRF